MTGQADGAVERLRQPKRARARGHQRDVEIAAAGQFGDAEQFAGAGLQIDVGELELGLHVGDRVGARDPERALGDAAIHLRLRSEERRVEKDARSRRDWSSAVCSSDLASPNGFEPEATSETLRLPRPDSLVMPNNSLAQACRSTSANWNWAFTSAIASERATPNEPLAMPPYICASPTESASAPPRRFAPNAVRPSFVEPTVTRAADRRMSRSVVDSEFRSNSCRFQSRA